MLGQMKYSCLKTFDLLNVIKSVCLLNVLLNDKY